MTTQHADSLAAHVCSSSCTSVRWRVADQDTSTAAYLYHLDIPSCFSVKSVLKSLLRVHQTPIASRVQKILLCRRALISEAYVSFLSPSQLEAQRPPYLVSFSKAETNTLFTSSLRRPELLAGCTDFLAMNSRFTCNDVSSDPGATQHAILIGWETSKIAVVYMAGIVTLLTVLVGVLVGVLAHDASLGIATSSGLAAVLACLEVVLIWQSH